MTVDHNGMLEGVPVQKAESDKQDVLTHILSDEGQRELYERSPIESDKQEADRRDAIYRKALAMEGEPAVIGGAAAHPIASADVQKLDKPAQVGNTRFGVGVKWSTVIAAAQRHHDYMNTPEKEALRIENGARYMKDLQDRIAANRASGEGEKS